MQPDPIMEWQRLAEHYRQIGDEELCELAADIADLTDTAQQTLRQELRSRGLGEPETALQTLAERTKTEASTLERAEQGVRQPADEEPPGPSVSYTWKTVLCECEERIESVQLFLVLKHAGIESWIERPGSGLVYSRVLVAADQLGEARAIIANPIPQNIVDEANEMLEPTEEFEAPVCPKCGAADPILESAEPTNEWLCEACGAEWADPIEDGDAKAETA